MARSKTLEADVCRHVCVREYSVWHACVRLLFCALREE